ncbi:MAG: class I SAM-dependent methyltransferase [Chloroflexi bacterium]|nr:class I SAM-dependent methyltransferase [Chloroflexota bacterium]
MEPSEYQTMFTVEDRHWWYVGMQQISLALLHQYYGPLDGRFVLDAGCGTGAAMRYLEPFGRVTGCDYSPLALAFCRQRGLVRLYQGSVRELPFGDGRFDLITSFDVLYHRSVGDYYTPLAEFHRVLKPGGRLFLRLPAYNWLRAHHDQVIHTAHRFTTQDLRRAFQKTGFLPEKLTYANTLLFPLALFSRLAERLRPPQGETSDVKPNPPWLDNLLVRFLRAEARWLVRHNLPYGLTVIAIGRKPEAKDPSGPDGT